MLLDGLEKALTQGVEAGWNRNFLAIHFGYVKDVDDLIEMSADLGNVQHESGFEKRLRNALQQEKALLARNEMIRAQLLQAEAAKGNGKESPPAKSPSTPRSKSPPALPLPSAPPTAFERW